MRASGAYRDAGSTTGGHSPPGRAVMLQPLPPTVMVIGSAPAYR